MQRCKYTDAKTHDLDRHSCTDTHTHKYTQSTDEDIQTQKAQIQKHTEKIQIHRKKAQIRRKIHAHGYRNIATNT